MDLNIRGKRAVVTGASKGIGAAIASTLASEGVDLVLTSRSTSDLDTLAHSLRSEHDVIVDVVGADLSTTSGRHAVVDAVGAVDILVNNAGAIPAGALAEIDEDAWRRAWDLKVYGYIFLTRTLYPTIATSSGGVILNVVGVASEDLPAGYIAGAAGNSSLIGFTKALAKDSWRDGVRVVGINPGYVATGRRTTLLRARAAEELGDERRWRELDAELPFGRAASPDEIASAAAFLVSPLSGYTNGAILTINGGVPM